MSNTYTKSEKKDFRSGRYSFTLDKPRRDFDIVLNETITTPKDMAMKSPFNREFSPLF